MGEDVVIRGRIRMDRSVRGSIRMDNAIRGNTREILTEIVGYDFDDTPTEGSENPVTSDGIYRALQPKADRTEVPTKVSELENDAGFISQETDPTVPSWAKAANKPSYTASEVGALPDTTTIPSKTSELQNDSGYLTTETDPTVPSWAKEANPPSYELTYDESVSVGSAVVGEAVTGEPNYTPTGTVTVSVTTSTETFMSGGSVGLNSYYGSYKLYITGLTFTPTTTTKNIVTGINNLNFTGNGVKFAVEQEQ